MPGYIESWKGQSPVEHPMKTSDRPGPSGKALAPPLPYPSSSAAHPRSPTENYIAGFESKEAPTGLAAEPLNIIILGASFGGLSCAHAFLDTTLERISKIQRDKPLNYRLVIVGPSTHIYWNIAAPRALVKDGLVDGNVQFMDIKSGFDAPGKNNRIKNYSLIQGKCVSMDAASRMVSIECTDEEARKNLAQISPKTSDANATFKTYGEKFTLPSVQTIPYHALIMCTGTSARSELLSLHGNYLDTQLALTRTHRQIDSAKSIVVCGGGCSGVEVAGQLATYLNYKRHFPFRVKSDRPKKITLLSGGNSLLKEMPHPEVGIKAEKMLTKLGVVISHNKRVKNHEAWFDQTGATRITFEDGTTHITDVYIDCTGVTPNSDYAPESIKTSDGYIATNLKTMRVDSAGERVYAIGDVASYSKNYVLDVYHGVPIVMQNLMNDLLIHEWKLANPYADHQDKIDALEHEEFQPSPKNTQICPINRFGGVGTFWGNILPSFAVYLAKGKTYAVEKAKKVTVNGGNPYALPGQQYNGGSRG